MPPRLSGQGGALALLLLCLAASADAFRVHTDPARSVLRRSTRHNSADHGATASHDGAASSRRMRMRHLLQAPRNSRTDYTGDYDYYTEVDTPLSDALVQGQDALSDVEKRPLSVHFEVVDGGVSNGDLNMVKFEMLPALSSLLARSIRVRRPSGTLSFEGVKPKLINKKFVPKTTKADMVVVITVEESSILSAACSPGVAAATLADLVEQGTGRPLLGQIFVCSPWEPSLDRLLQVVAHEMLHLLGWSSDLVEHYWAYSPDGPFAGQNASVQVYDPSADAPALVPAPAGLRGPAPAPRARGFGGGSALAPAQGPVGIVDGISDYEYDYCDYSSDPNTKTYLSTPQVLAEVRRHFDCPSLPGALAEDSGGCGTVGVSHLENSVFYNSLMQGLSTLTADTFDSTVLTDLDLALLQDTGWFDVKYGSSGFSTFGYHAGCAFGQGDADAVRANATTSDLLCSEEETRRCTFEGCFYEVSPTSDLWRCLNRLPGSCSRCTQDHRGTGACYASSLGGRFAFVQPVPDAVDYSDNIDFYYQDYEYGGYYDYYDYWAFAPWPAAAPGGALPGDAPAPAASAAAPSTGATRPGREQGGTPHKAKHRRRSAAAAGVAGAASAPAAALGVRAPAVAPGPLGAAAAPLPAPGLKQRARQLFSADCAAMPGSRCAEAAHGGAFVRQKCHDMRCDAHGQVLVDGQPCNPSQYDCPDAVAMCKDPGLLTCIGNLNDCSGHGTCYKGFCYCFIGWGGARCDKPLCQGSCPDGTSCPASGFCGEAECGEWSEGQQDRGTPCNFAGGLGTSNAAPK